MKTCMKDYELNMADQCHHCQQCSLQNTTKRNTKNCMNENRWLSRIPEEVRYSRRSKTTKHYITNENYLSALKYYRKYQVIQLCILEYNYDSVLLL